ncbi:MAG: hypothetical protein HY299_04125 [Verrucomicrobia bacterium]|nr:hypothetical protein [Verrucomicrobiota bacterium]
MMASPDESLFRLHLEQAPFQLGASLGKWGLHQQDGVGVWPHAVLWVDVDQRFITDGRMYLRFTVDGYPQQAPTACPWDILENKPLAPERWPKGEVNVSRVFKPSWNPSALYAPCDRLAMIGHEIWRQQFPRWWWQPDFTIVRYLEFVHDCLEGIHE